MYYAIGHNDRDTVTHDHDMYNTTYINVFMCHINIGLTAIYYMLVSSKYHFLTRHNKRYS